MVDPHSGGCPAAEVLAAYVDRGLSLAERARVDAHLASCPQCIALVAGVVRTVAEVSAHVPGVPVAAEATPLVTRRSLAGALSAAAAVIAVVSAPLLLRPWLERDPGLVSLVSRVGEQRSVLGRLTGGFPHAPLGVPSAGGQDGRTAATDPVQLTAARIHESFGDRQTPSQLHAYGVSQLLGGHYDDAAQALLAASREQPANAQYLSDVAAVQLERARLGLRPDDLPRALAAADRARRLDPSLREAWFNRALAASALSLTTEAKTAWAEYLKRDNASPWATEARARLADLAKPTPAQAWVAIEGRLQQSIDASTADEAVRAQTTEARRLIEENLLPNWAATVLAGRSASAELDRVRVMAAAMLRDANDALYVDTVAAIDRATNLAALARAHQQYAAAAAVFKEDQYARALPMLREAKAALDAARSPYASRPALDVASIVYAGGGYAESEQLLIQVLETAQSHRYSFAEGRASWIQGLTAFMQGRLGDAQSKYEDTLAIFTQSNDAEQIAAAHTLLAGLFYYLGDQGQAWTHFVPALKGLDITRSLKLRHALLSAAAMSVRDSDPAAALAIQDEAVRNAEQWGFPMAIAEAFASRASIRISLGQHSDASVDLVEAKKQSALTDPAVKSRLEITIVLAESKLLRQTNPAAAVAAAQHAIAIVEQRKDRFRLPQLQLELANANIVSGRTADAEVALERGIRAFDQERSTLLDEGRASTHDEAWGLFESAVHIGIQKKDYERAFAMAERGRVRSLAEARRMAANRNISQVQAALTEDEALIALNQFEDELAIWVIRRGLAHVTLRKLTRDQAQRLVAEQQNDIWQETASGNAGRVLYKQLLRPVSRQLEGIKRLVIIPDTTFENVAFPALVDSSDNRFLIEEMSVSLAPSANAFVAARERGRERVNATDPLVFGGVGTVAAADAHAIAAAYRSPTVMVGETATRGQFFAAVPSRSIVHLAVPVSVSVSNPLLSRARVADEPGLPHSGEIFGRDIAAKDLSGTNLVVIDEVEIGPNNRGEGTLSMARAFMAAGVPAVLGTLPGADSEAIRDLMIGFHRAMSQGMSAEQALQTVQRNAIQENGRRVGAWSALVLYGSDR